MTALGSLNVTLEQTEGENLSERTLRRALTGS